MYQPDRDTVDIKCGKEIVATHFVSGVMGLKVDHGCRIESREFTVYSPKMMFMDQIIVERAPIVLPKMNFTHVEEDDSVLQQWLDQNVHDPSFPHIPDDDEIPLTAHVSWGSLTVALATAAVVVAGLVGYGIRHFQRRQQEKSRKNDVA